MILFIKHVEIEGPETLGSFFANKGCRIMVVNLHDGDCLPDDPRGLEAIIPLGGPMNVYEEDRYTFLKEENVFLQKALQERIPILGICLGAQLLSKAAGGKVTTSPQGEIGWFTVDVTEEGQRDPLFKDLPNLLEVYQWHNDMCQPPEGAVILASSVRCPVQAFRWGKKAYGLQFHAEITGKSIHDWSHALPAAVRKQEHEKMFQRYCKIKKTFLQRGEHMAENFFRIMKGL